MPWPEAGVEIQVLKQDNIWTDKGSDCISLKHTLQSGEKNREFSLNQDSEGTDQYPLEFLATERERVIPPAGDDDVVDQDIPPVLHGSQAWKMIIFVPASEQ